MLPLFVLAIEVYVVVTALGHLCHSEPQLLAFTAFHTGKRLLGSVHRFRVRVRVRLRS